MPLTPELRREVNRNLLAALGLLSASVLLFVGLIVALVDPAFGMQARRLGVLIAIAPVVGSARVTAAAGAIVRGVLGAEVLAEQGMPGQRTS